MAIDGGESTQDNSAASAASPGVDADAVVGQERDYEKDQASLRGAAVKAALAGDSEGAKKLMAVHEANKRWNKT